MMKIRCKMARIQNKDDASKELNFKTLAVDGEIQNPTIKEEFVQVIEEFKIPVYFSKTSTMAKIHSYLNIMYKYAGKEIEIMIENFTNTAVYAFIIGTS